MLNQSLRHSLSIMVSKLGDFQALAITFAAHTVDETVFTRDAPRLPAAEIAFQWLRFADPFEGNPLRSLDKFIDPLQALFVAGGLPPEVVLPSLIGEDEPHNSILRSMSWPAFN